MFTLEQRLMAAEQSQSGQSENLDGARQELEQLQIQHRKEITRLVSSLQ